YPVNHVLEYAARADIRSIICRQERIGLHMADAISRVTSGENIGVFAMQHGPGAENAFGGVAQAFGDSAPILVLPMGYGSHIAHVKPNFNSTLNFQHVTKSVEPLVSAADVPDVMRRAFTQLRSGRPGPVMVEIPSDIMMQDMPGDLNYTPSTALRSGPDPQDVDRVAEALVAAKRPVIYAGQGVHYAKAWDALKSLAEMLAAPVTSSLGGKSAFPEGHDLALGSGGRSMPAPVHEFLQKADLIFGIGCSFTKTNFGVTMPAGKKIVHATLDPADINKDVACELALVGDAKLTLDALNEAVRDRLRNDAREAAPVKAEIAAVREPWLAQWEGKLTSNETPLSPYRVLWDLANTVDRDNTIITHDAGSPRDQISPFWQSDTPLSYIGWGKTTQLGYGLGLAMGAKLAHPDKLCINVWGDAAIGFTGMDFETAVRERIPILSILLNNFSMAIELKVMPVSTEKYRSTDISGDYAAMARAFGGLPE
ncbi:MAG: thiamine pyrophosphate-requiring protein, partial [Pseudomonadota bacterium]